MKSITPIFLILIIIGCGVWLFMRNASKPAPGETVMHSAPLKCTACGKSWAGEIGEVPGKCPFCGEQTVWEALKCAKCGEIIPRITIPKFGATPDKCPKCGGTHFVFPEPKDLDKP